MNLKTITFDADQWQLVPKVMDTDMRRDWHDCYSGDIQVRWASALAAAPQPEILSPWIPIESAPKDGSNFYVTGFNYGNASNGRRHDVGHVTPRGGIKSTLTWLSLDFATHWMPLPQPPETK